MAETSALEERIAKVRAAGERDGIPLLRFAATVTSDRGAALAIVAGALASAAQEAGDALARADLASLVRRRAAQHVESAKRRGETSPSSPSKLRALVLDVRPTEREALLLRYVAGFAVPDVAKACHTDEAAIRKRLSRALVQLARASGGAEPPAVGPGAALSSVSEHLSELLDGLAPDEVSDFAATDDASRDLVHDAERLVSDVRGLEADWVPDVAELSARAEELLGQVAAPREPALREAVHDSVETPPLAEVADGGEPKEPSGVGSRAEGPASGEERGASGRDATGVSDGESRLATEKAREERAPLAERLGPKGRLAVVLGGVAALAAFVFAASRPSGAPSEYSDASWSGKVTEVSHAFGGGAGLERCSPDRAVCSPIQKGDDVPAGSTLRTDGQTRAIVDMRDGTRVSLDRSTELLLDSAFPRRARIEHGAVVAELPSLGTSRSRLDVPLGFVEAGTAKLSIVADPERVSVEVVRGSARLVDERERGVGIHAGEEGTVEPGGPPTVTPTAFFGSTTRWSEQAFASSKDTDIVGLGELRAKKPGQEQERRGAVTLASHSTKVRIVGSVARTEIEEVFTNATDEVLEGIFRFPLPPDSQIERLALDVDGRLEEGAFVDRERAAAIWRGAIVNAGAKKPAGEEIVWVPGPWRDPALLEWQRGGRFELRIYPIPKRGSRRVILAYTQVIPPAGAGRRYVYPLPVDPSGSTRVGRFDVDVEVRGHDPKRRIVARGYDVRPEALPDGAAHLHFGSQNFVPSGDLAVEYRVADADREVTAWAYQPTPDEVASSVAPAPGDPAALSGHPMALGQGGAAPYVAVALRPRLPRADESVRREFAIVVDSSRSMFGERYQRAVDLAKRLVRELDPSDPVTVLACDSACRELSSAHTAGADAARSVDEFFRGIAPEGASDVAGAVRRARDAIRSRDGSGRIVYIGDGTPTVGAVLPAFVRKEIEAAVPREVATVTTVAIGADADTGTLRIVAEAGGGAVVPYAPGESVADAAYQVLGATYGSALADATLDVPEGMTDIAPRRLPTIPAGGEVIVVGRLARPSLDGSLVLRGHVGGAAFEQRYPIRLEATTAKGNAFVPRLWAAAKLAELEQEPDAESRKRAVELSGQFHVACRYTSLLVLESPAMFRAFGLTQSERVAEWSGETDATSTEADGETALAGKGSPGGGLGDDAVDNPYDGDPRDKAKKAEGSLGGLGAASGGAFDSRSASAKAASPEPMKPAPMPKRAASGSYDAEQAQPSPAAAPAPAGDLLRNRDEAAAPQELAAPRGPGGGPLLWEPPTRPRPPPPMRRWIPMRKIWERVAQIVTPPAVPSSASADAIQRAEREVQDNELRRDAVKRLYTALFLAGELDRAADVAERWSAKDPLDPDALTARADLAAARGERDLAIRILGSVVDVRPGDHKAQWRLARLHRWAGRAELGCRHSMAVAQIRSTDAKILSEAVRCAREVGRADVASDLEAAASDATRRAAEQLLREPAPDPSALSGDVRLSATWEGGDDLDLAMLHPEGRISWLGAPTKAVITARDVDSPSREGLGLRGAAPGDYLVEITRPAGHSGTVRGSVDVTAAGDRRTIPFVLDGARVRIALLKVSMKSRLVPL